MIVEKGQTKLRFETVTGLLAQDDPRTDDKTFDFIRSDFGLLKSSWADFRGHIDNLIKDQGEHTRYKVLYLARHGQGYHNLAEEEYGKKLWDDVLSKQYGNDKYTWGPDPELTEKGINQAKENHKAWEEQKSKGVVLPVVFYASPFTRALDTMQYTWNGILFDTEGSGSSIKPPLVVEDLREDNGVHTCDMRRTKSFIENRFPRVVVEKGFTEQDELWDKDHRETKAEHNQRTLRFLNHLFELDWDSEEPEVYISVTSHSGTINSFLDCIGHRGFSVQTGGMIPVVVKATRVTNKQ